MRQPILFLLHPLRHRYISTSDSKQEACLWMVEHHVKMFHSLDAFEVAPVLEPCHLFSRYLSLLTKHLIHQGINGSSSFARQVSCLCIFFKLKFGPNNEMDDIRIKPIGPVIVEDLVICRLGEPCSAGRGQGRPLQSIFDYEVADGAEFFFQLRTKLQIFS